MLDSLGRQSAVDQSKEKGAVARRHGKWSQRSLPHKGWRCVEVEDRGEPDHTCEMCESAEVRCVHYMKHDKYPDELAVGCVCAGNVEQDLEGALQRDRTMVSRAQKRALLAHSALAHFSTR